MNSPEQTEESWLDAAFDNQFIDRAFKLINADYPFGQATLTAHEKKYRKCMKVTNITTGASFNMLNENSTPNMKGVVDLLNNLIQRQPDKLLSDKSVAEILNVSKDQVWRLTRAGELPKPRIIKAQGRVKGSTRWLHSEIMRYINSLPPVN